MTLTGHFQMIAERGGSGKHPLSLLIISKLQKMKMPVNALSTLKHFQTTLQIASLCNP